jgi:CHAT domain-containing protein
MLKARLILDNILVPPLPLKSPGQEKNIAALEKRILGFPPDDTSKDDLYMTETKLLSHLSSFSPLESEDRRQAIGEVEKIYQSAGYTAVASPATLAEVQGSLLPSEAILEYVIPYNALHPASDLGIIWIARNRFEVVHIDLEKVLPSRTMTGSIAIDGKAPVDFSPLGQTLVATRSAIRNSDEKTARTNLHAFYELLIKPLVSKGFKPESYSQLVIIPHGVLQYLPFAALLDDSDSPLIKKTAIAMAPSASVWNQLLKRHADVRGWVAYANPKLAGADLDTLDNTQREVEQIAPLLTGLTTNIKLGQQASRGRFLEEAPSASILHVATHGLFPDENALDDHALLLASDGGGDGILAARDIRRLKLNQVRLAVLSVCNGGLYRMGPTDEPYGLVPAFFEAGAQNVLATLWPVDDAFGRRFTVEFYRRLLKDGPAEALRQASLHFIGEDEFIRRRAGFVVAGPGRPLSLPQ